MGRLDIRRKLSESIFLEILVVLSALSILPLVLFGVLLIDGVNDMGNSISATTETMSASVEQINEDMRLKNREHEKDMYENILAHTVEMTNITRAEMYKVGEIAKIGGNTNESVEIARRRMEGESQILRHEITRDVRDMAENIDTAAFMTRDRLSDAAQELKNSADYTLRQTTNKLLIFLAIMIVIGFLAALMFTRLIIKPIYELTRGAEAISKGDLSYRVNINSRDEFGVLASTFNQMAQDLEAYSGQMEQKVEERTCELKREKDITKSISDSIMDGIMLLSKDLKIVKANKSLLDCMGLKKSDVIGEYCYKITHELDEPCKAPLDTCPVIEVLTTGEAAIETHIHIDRAGNRRYIAVTAYPVTDDDGTISGFVHVSRDVTERKRLEEGLIDSEKRYKGLFERNPSALYALDDLGYFSEINKKFIEITGYEIDDLRDKTPEDLFSRKDETLLQRYYTEKAKYKDLPFAYEMPIITKSGKEIMVNVRANVDTSEKIAIGSINDITERKNMERQLDEYTHQLEQIVDKRTREVKLERDKFEDSAKKLKQSNELKDLFIDIMRHDLLNPVGVIENCSDFMLDEEPDGDRRKLLIAINRSAERLTEMIEDASKYAMLEELESVDMQAFDTDELVKEVLEVYESSAKEKNITIEYHASENYTFKASPLIKDAISNILSNAIKHGPGNTKVIVDIQKGPPFIISIKDNGPGIPDDEKERIFERFKRIKKRGVKGSGLGLAIVKRIVYLHGGRAWVEDNPEGGSIFKIELPE